MVALGIRFAHGILDRQKAPFVFNETSESTQQVLEAILEVENRTMRKQPTKLLILLTVLLGLSAPLASQALAQPGVSHNYVNTYRSSSITHFFVSQSIEGEYGDYQLNSSSGTGLTTQTSKTEKWRGYNLTQTFGLELLKFVQLNVGHSMINMRSSSSALERMGGSRFSAGARFVFLAPVANLEAGGGMLGTRYEYQKDLTTSDFYGSGVYYTLGFNYFISEKISVFGQAKSIDELSMRTNGDPNAKSIRSQTTNLGTGFTLWL